MSVIHNTDTGHVYSADTQFIRHETSWGAARRTAKHTATGTVLELSDGDFKEYLNARGIPLDASTAVLGGKLWSATTGLIDARTLTVG